jgi:ribosomal protein S18 acetylase RimI-like enzyme
MTALTPPPIVADAVTLRPVHGGDGELLYAIYASTRTGELAQVAWDDAQKDRFLRMQFEAQRKFYESEYPGAEFQVILAAGKPAGRLYVHRREQEIRIMDIALLPEFRGRGIATRLLNEILAEGERTTRPVTIHVESFNPARWLYERLGFAKIADNGVYHLLEWKPPAVAIGEEAFLRRGSV